MTVNNSTNLILKFLIIVTLNYLRWSQKNWILDIWSSVLNIWIPLIDDVLNCIYTCFFLCTSRSFVSWRDDFLQRINCIVSKTTHFYEKHKNNPYYLWIHFVLPWKENYSFYLVDSYFDCRTGCKHVHWIILLSIEMNHETPENVKFCRGKWGRLKTY